MRELLATSVILGMCAGRWGRNGSSRRRISAPNFAKSRLDRDRGFYLGIPPAGTPKYWFLDRGIWAKKNPIARPIDCYFDCERRRYFEKIANTLAFWRQKRQQPLKSYAFSYFFRPILVLSQGNRLLERVPDSSPSLPQTFPSQSNFRDHCPSKINENR